MRTLAIAAFAGGALFTGIVTAGAADMAVKAAPMAAPSGATNARLTVDQATARLNYRFGGPVVAKY